MGLSVGFWAARPGPYQTLPATCVSICSFDRLSLGARCVSGATPGAGDPAVGETATALFPEPDLGWGRETLPMMVTHTVTEVAAG